MFFTILAAFISGIIFALVVEVILIYQWWLHKPKEEPSHHVSRSKVKNPEELRNLFKKLSGLSEEDIRERLQTPETCVCLNVIFAFLWKEWRDSPEMKQIFISKLTQEFNDFIGSKAAKGIIEEIRVKSYSLGESLPIIKDATLLNIKSQSVEDVPDEIDIALNITYSGGFYISADFALALNKSVYLSIKVVKISGKVKLSFRRNPTSRWSFSFYEEPEPTIELDAESRLEGKNFQQLNSLILKHFKKVIRQKYILPNYIVRYRPFLRVKIPQDETKALYIHNSQVTVGSVAVQVICCSRLPLKKKTNGESWTFCSLSVDSIPFAERKNDDPSLWPISECEVVRGNERKIGLTFQEVSHSDGDNSQKKIIIDSIDRESPVDYSSLKEGDIILEINGMAVVDAKQASKLIRGSSRRLSIMVKRPPSCMPISKTRELSQNIDLDSRFNLAENSGEVYDVDDFKDEFINIMLPLIVDGPGDCQSFKGKNEDTISNLSLPLSENEHSGKFKTELSNAVPLEKQKNNDGEEIFDDDSEKVSYRFEQKTKLVTSSKIPQWNETFELRVEKEHKYLNVLVWYQIPVESSKEDNNEELQKKDILLGYVTIPLTDIAVQCLETGDRYHQQEYVLVSTAYDKVFARCFPQFTMSFFVGTLCALVLICCAVHWKTRSGNTSKQGSGEFQAFQRTYITVYLFAVAADWLQGPHVYVLYESYGLSSKQIGQLFVGGFGSSMVFGTFIGSLADRCGRRLNCLIYALLYGVACFTKHFNDFNILMGGRILAGIATSILFSAFESWAICEHSSRQLNGDSLGTLFANAVLGNSIVAVIAGFVAELAASSFGFVAPFDVALCTLIIMAGIMMFTWNENYGDKTGDNTFSFNEAVTAIRKDRKVLFLGLMQSLFEGAMYTFVLEWTPALTASYTSGENKKIPHGLIFSAFMIAVMIGSALFKILCRRTNVESFMRIVYIIATIALSTPVFMPRGDILIYFSFLVFECCVGIFWPAMATMRGQYVPEKTRSTIMNIFRIPLNLIVITVLLQDLPLNATFILCAIFLACCTLVQELFYRSMPQTEESLTNTTV